MSNQIKHFQVREDGIGMRLDQFLTVNFPDKTRSKIQKHISDGEVLVNGTVVKNGYKLHAGDIIDLDFSNHANVEFEPEAIPLNIEYEDDDLLVVNKPAGLVVHPGAGNYSGTLVNGLLYHCKSLSGLGESLRPGIVHRLDKNTSGLMVVAKKDAVHLALQKQFDTREIVRTYQALVWGTPVPESGTIDTLIDRSRRDRKKMTVANNRGKPAITRYRVIRDFTWFSLLELELKTGRTHQIRVHLNYIHHPVFGDPDYNGRASQLNRLPAWLRTRAQHLLKIMTRQTLHAKCLQFIHPTKKKLLKFESALPDDFALLLEKLPKAMMLTGE